MHIVRQVVHDFDLSAIHRAYQAERGRPPFHPEAMVGLLLYGACRGIYSSRKLAQACRDHIAFMYLTSQAQPDFHTIAQFRKRFRPVLQDLFRQVLALCRKAGLVRLGHVSLDGTKVRANASKHKAMSYGRMLSKEQALGEAIRGWFEEAERQDAEEDTAYGPDDDGYGLPPELRESQKRLETIRKARARLEAEARAKAEREGKDPEGATPSERAQTNFTDPDSRIMHTPDGFQQCYNAQSVMPQTAVAVDAQSQVIVACEVSRAPPDVQRLRPMLDQITTLLFTDARPRSSAPTPDMPRKPTSPP